MHLQDQKPQLLSFKTPDCINNVILVNNLGRTPAMCFRKTGLIFISPEFLKLPVDFQKYIIGHEAGHIAQNTKNEFKADDYAVDWCIMQKMSLTNILFSMTKVLSFPEDKPNQKREQELRCQRQFERLFNYDATINKNPKAMEHINSTVNNEFDSFLGLKERRARKKEKTSAKSSKIKDEGEAKKLKAQATLELAKQGIVNKGLAGLGTGIGKLGDKTTAEAPQEGKILGMSKPMFFGVVAAVVILGGVALWYFKFKKSN